MKKMFLMLSCGLLAVSFAGAAAQDVDLSVSGINVVVDGGGMYINPEICLKAIGDVPAIDTTIDIYFDGIHAESLPWQIVPFQSGTCPLNVYPDCDGECYDLVLGSVTYFGSCQGEYIAAQTLWRCACHWYTYGEGQILHPILDQSYVTVRIDLPDTVLEWDEDNNEMTMDLGPVGDDEPTWSALKAIFR